MVLPMTKVELDRLRELRRRYDVAKDRLSALTKREREVFELVAAGMQTKAIAQKLQISPRTVDNHRAKILRTLKPESASALFRIAYDADLFAE